MSRIKHRGGLLALSLTLVVAGCGGRDASQTPEGPRVAGIVFQEDQFFRLVELGMRDAAQRGGATLMAGNSLGALDKEVGLIDSYVASGVDAIVISPLSAQASIPALKRAALKGIKVVTYNTTVDADLPVSYLESDQVDLGSSTGKAARAYIDAVLGGRAKVALIEFMSQAPEQCSQRVKGFRSVLDTMPQVEVVAEQDAWLTQQATEVVEQLITAHPDLDLVWAANEGGTVGAAIGVKNAGKAGRIVVFGTDMSEQLASLLLAEDGVLQAVTGQKPFELGSLAVDKALSAVAGQPVERMVSLPGVLFARDRPEEVEAYLERLRTLLR